MLPVLGAQNTGSAAPQATTAAPPARFAFGGNAAQIPADFVRNLIFLPVRVNGSRTFLFALDSSAATSSIDPEQAARLDVKLQAGNAGADSSSAFARDVLLELPGLQIPMASLPEDLARNLLNRLVSRHWAFSARISLIASSLK